MQALPRGRFSRLSSVPQAILGGCALLLSYLPDLPWPLQGALGLTLLIGLSARVFDRRHSRFSRMLTWAGWVASTCCVSAALWASRKIDFGDPYYAWIAWLTGASLLIGSGIRPALRLDSMRALAAVWFLLGTFLWLGAAYFSNHFLAFHAGLLIMVVLLIAARIGFRLSPVAIQGVNTGILFLIALPITDWAVRMRTNSPAPTQPDPRSVATAPGRDPNEFADWWRRYLEAWELMAKDLFIPDTKGVFRFRLKPGGVGHLMASRISINQLGFRGREIATDKGNTCRIVALGESTTFGCTLKESDRPWPELLESMILDRLSPTRPVEVVNAGVPAYSLGENVRRFKQEILPLAPDLILSYHGYNGFPMIEEWLRQGSMRSPPAYRTRPLRLLANLEHQLRTVWHRRVSHDRLIAEAPSPTGLLETPYAEAYQDLITLTKANEIPLVLCAFSMAVDPRSSAETVDFYRSVFPRAREHIRANQIHSAILIQLTRGDPTIELVDTRRALDGRQDYFIDLVHLTQEGRQRLAETILAGIAPCLTNILAGTAQSSSGRDAE